jgi:hypothetical protein
MEIIRGQLIVYGSNPLIAGIAKRMFLNTNLLEPQRFVHASGTFVLYIGVQDNCFVVKHIE